MQTATADPLVGRKLEGRYRILDRVARGGMSTVYAAVDERLDRLVAVKVMNAALSADPAFSDRFAREARAAARLTHLNAVSVYDQGHEIAADGHHVFLVMELIEGRTLRELIHERGKLAPAEAVSVMEPVLSALAAAHRAGLVHRDVKPENILLSDESVVKVADFGLARAVETDPSSTRTGLMMGTVAYCPPEQLSKGNADPRSDVYSAGIVLFELLTGHPPYRGDSAMNIAYQHVHSRVPAPSSRARGIPEEIDELVVAATDSDPSGRPSDAAAFLAELADVRTQLRLPVTPIPARQRRTPRVEYREPRHRTPTGPAEATTAALRANPGRHDTSVVPDRRPDGDPARRRGPREESSPPPPVVIPPPRQRTRKRGRRRGLLVVLLIIALGAGAFFGAKAFITWRFAHVPSVATLSPDAAIAKLKHAGYKARMQPGPVYSETISAGLVISTDPPSGTRLTTGHTVVITLSAGAHYYAVPNVMNKTPDQAKAALLTAGRLTIAPQPKFSYSDTVPANLVIGTTPAAGTKVRSGVIVTIVVSRGRPTVTIPNIAPNTPFDEARAALRKANFKVDRSDDYNDTVPVGAVVSISPTGSALKFSVVHVVVSKGPQNVKLPAIAVGTPYSVAKATLEGLGLTVENRQIGVRPDPVVYSMNPGAGTLVLVGSPVELTTL
ncbi:Stk1 family PASTA domain-containing Ser/Thr kinase [uncultured Jatrophihabitans sp.]|uniref:Stk1 family PASTA domain-containing Ser/Thr kinase n=1 Tax=uncultured Jatrophihabitans sp. TaxID=1610747 RepID=UPI0035CC9000